MSTTQVPMVFPRFNHRSTEVPEQAKTGGTWWGGWEDGSLKIYVLPRNSKDKILHYVSLVFIILIVLMKESAIDDFKHRNLQ